MDEKVKSTEEPKATGDPKAKAGDQVEVMKSFGLRIRHDGKKVRGGGGIFTGVLPDGSKFKMVPGQVRTLPKQVVEKYNAASKKGPIFVEPGSQEKGATIK